jgi:glucose/arabinose dehydrogenase
MIAQASASLGYDADMRALACLLVAMLWPSAAGAQPIGASVYASGFSLPVAIVQDPTNRNVQFVVEQGGRIRVVSAGTVLAQDFLDLRGSVLSGGEQGLLGMALAPNYASSGWCYVNFTNVQGDTVVARFTRSANPLVADAASRLDLRWGGSTRIIDQPFANHNGGHLAFGPDGFLYVGLGDGGAGNDPQHRAQNPTQLLGKMLRIDINVNVDDPNGYWVPPSNPFVNAGPAGTLPEIWSFGLRNPWRYSFDDPARGGTGALIMGDVGQGAWEEIDYEPAGRGGRNYGWSNREGAHNNVSSPGPAFGPLVDPVFEYDRSSGASVTGGYVYRGQGLGAGYRGRYFFADFVSGRVWSVALTVGGGGEATASDLIEHTAMLGGRATLGNVSSFGVDADGELFIVNYAGSILRVVGPPLAPTGLRIIPQLNE